MGLVVIEEKTKYLLSMGKEESNYNIGETVKITSYHFKVFKDIKMATTSKWKKRTH